MQRFTFNKAKTLEVLKNGKTRVYFDHQTFRETPAAGEDGTQGSPVTMHSYRAADIPAGEPVTKSAIVNAIVRSEYSQADVEAIMRHKLAGVDSDEFDTFNAFAEAAKARAVEILE